MSKKINNSKLSELYNDYLEEGYEDNTSYQISRGVKNKRKLIKKRTSKARRRFNNEEE